MSPFHNCNNFAYCYVNQFPQFLRDVQVFFNYSKFFCHGAFILYRLSRLFSIGFCPTRADLGGAYVLQGVFVRGLLSGGLMSDTHEYASYESIRLQKGKAGPQVKS